MLEMVIFWISFGLTLTVAVSFFELKWEKYGGWRKNFKTAINYADFKKNQRTRKILGFKKIFSTKKNSTRALLTHDCIIPGTVSHRVYCKLQKHQTKSFKIAVLNSLPQQQPFKKNDFISVDVYTSFVLTSLLFKEYIACQRKLPLPVT